MTAWKDGLGAFLAKFLHLATSMKVSLCKILYAVPIHSSMKMQAAELGWHTAAEASAVTSARWFPTYSSHVSFPAKTAFIETCALTFFAAGCSEYRVL